MRFGGWVMAPVAGCGILMVLGGCASMDDQRANAAALRNVRAEKQALQQDLFDARSNNDALRARFEASGRELDTNSQLVANLRKENDLLDGIRVNLTDQLERMAANQTLGDISISGPKLPEQLHSALKTFAQANPSTVAYDAGRGTVKWKSDLLFALGSDVIKPKATESLRSFTQIIMSPAASGFEAIVVGHTDNTPIKRAATKQRHPTNWHLSTHRAISVASVLRQYGYPPVRISVMGFGEHRPVSDNATEVGKSQNRRVEIYLVPVGTIVKSASRSATSTMPKSRG